MAVQVVMPQLGESVVEGTVMRWLRQEGESIQEMENLLEVSTDKVATEIPSPASGVLLKILTPEGVTVKAGTVIAWIGNPGEELPGGAKPLDHTQPAAAQTQPVPAAVPARRELGFISPVVARLAEEQGVDLSQVKGSGEGGRITKKDVLAFIEARKGAAPEPAAWETPGSGDLFKPTELLAPIPASQAPKAPEARAPEQPVSTSGGRDTLVPHSIVRKAIAGHMVMSKHTAPHVTTVMEADLLRVTRHREAHRAQFERDAARLTFSAYFAAAAVAALKAHPAVNSSWSDEGLLLHAAVNLGIAVSLGAEGLIVPVIKNADGLSLLGMARAIQDLAERARSRRLQPDEVRGGTFSITNHGTGRSLFATPVINQPQSAILGVGAIHKRPVVVEGDAIAVRPMVYLSLTFDHRVLDGEAADGFLAHIVDTLERWE